MTEYFTFDGHRFRVYLFHIFCVIAILSAAGCGDQTAEQGTSEHVTPAASDTGSASFSIQWHTASTDRSAAGALARQAIEDCGETGVASITCDVYDEYNTPIASGGPWPCDDHSGRIEKIAAGSNRTFAVLGWNAAEGGGDVVYQGQTAGITITPGAIADAGTIDVYAFVPAGLAPTAIYGNRIDLAWGDLGSAGASGYRIYRDGEAIADTASPTYSDSNLSPNTQYCYTISAYDDFGNESGQSDPACQTTSETSIWYRDGDEDGYGNPADSTQTATQPEGYVPDNTDCNDASASIHPNATETCNAIDDNCDGTSDEGVQNTYYGDSDGDGYGDTSNPTQACEAPEGYVADNTDCRDNNASIHPGVSETCNQLDDDCDGSTDEGVQNTYYRDADEDNYGDPNSPTQACAAPEGYVTDNTDCRDNNAAINPGATEIADEMDNDCDGSIDEDLNTYYRDADEDGYGNPDVSTQAVSQPSGYVSNRTDCNDASASVHPGAAETCNGIDDDCDQSIDEVVQNTYYLDADGDQYGDASQTIQACAATEGYVADNTDCRDNNASVHPGAAETCNGIDDDCDQSIDEGVQNTYYRDYDGDQYGDPNSPTQACAAQEGYVANSTDCNDEDFNINPGENEICFDGIDNNCDYQIDENCVIANEDCLNFDPNDVYLVDEENQYVLMYGNSSILLFPNKEEATQAMETIREYGINSQCFIGRPDSSMKYWLVNGRAPSGGLPNEDCLGFDPNRLSIVQSDSQWFLMYGNSSMLLFPNKEEAIQSLETIQYYQMNNQCFIGRPDPSMEYWRR